MFRTSARSLAVALDHVLPAIASRGMTMIPVLATALFRTIGAELIITVTNLDLEMDVRPTVETNGTDAAICIDPRRLLAILRLLPRNDAVEVTIDGTGAVLTWNGGRMRMAAIVASDFPLMPMGEPIASAPTAASVVDGLSRVFPSISRDETRYYLNGVCVDGETLVATDGHRLSAVHGGECLAPIAAALKAGFIVPRDAVVLWRKIAERHDTTLTVYGSGSAGPSPTKIEVAGEGGLTLRAKLIDGTFPLWRKTLPKDDEGLITISAPRFALLRAAGLVVAARASRHAHGAVKVDAGRVQIVARQLDDDTIAADVGPCAAADQLWPMNVTYLLAALHATRGKTVELKLPAAGDGFVPFLLHGSEDGPTTHFLVMGLRYAGDMNFSAPAAQLAEAA